MANTASPTTPRFDVAGLVVTVLVGALATVLVWPQIFPGPEMANEATLSNLNKRASMLEKITDPIQRDSMCIGLSAYGRQLDKYIPKDARIFFYGMAGKEFGPRLGYYFFFRNYLFPRDVQVTLERGAYFAETGFFDGSASESPQLLQTNGYDLLLKFQDNGQIQLLPLTQKGVPLKE